jgi:hypothetical protein
MRRKWGIHWHRSAFEARHDARQRPAGTARYLHLSKQIGDRLGLPIDMSAKASGIEAIANALNEGNVARAQVAAVLMGIPDPPPLTKGSRSHSEMTKFIRDLHWSGLIKVDWDPDEHPRWPAGAPDSQGGQFAPKSGADTRSAASAPVPSHRDTRIQLADAGMSDAADDPVAEATARAAIAVRSDNTNPPIEQEDKPNLILAAAEGEDERDPRFGIGGNHPPPEELIPQRLLQSPAGPVVQFFDNLLDITGPGDEANLDVATLQMRALLHAIHEVDPSYVYQSIEPPGGLAGMSWQGRLNVINGLRADLAAAIYGVRGDIRPLQELTLEFMQQSTNAAYEKALQRYNEGELDVRLNRGEAIGNDMDGTVRLELREFFNRLGISTESGSAIRVNRRAYDTSISPSPYRLPDARVGNLAFDTSLTAKSASDRQIRGFFAADFAPIGVVIIRPNQLGNNSSYIIWRPDGE